MKTETELTAEITKITGIIRERFPEILAFLEEMPVTIPDEKNPQINIKTLEDYSSSLKDLINKYALEHSLPKHLELIVYANT